MTNPKATLHMANGADIVIELLPQAAPNDQQELSPERSLELAHTSRRTWSSCRVPVFWNEGL